MLNNDQHEFHMEEYKQLRAEVITLLARIETLLRYSLVVSAAVYAWLVAQAVGVMDKSGPVPCLRLPAELLVYGWWIPPVFVVLAGLGAAVTRWRVWQMSAYLSRLEKEMGHPAPLGWEGYLKEKSSVITWTTIGVWVLVLGATMFGSFEGIKVTKDAAHIVCPEKASS